MSRKEAEYLVEGARMLRQEWKVVYNEQAKWYEINTMDITVTTFAGGLIRLANHARNLS